MENSNNQKSLDQNQGIENKSISEKISNYKNKKLLIVFGGIILIVVLAFFTLSSPSSLLPKTDDWVYDASGSAMEQFFENMSTQITIGVMAGILILGILFVIFGKKVIKKNIQLKSKRRLGKIMKFLGLIIIYFYLTIAGAFFHFFIYSWISNLDGKLMDLQKMILNFYSILVVLLAVLFIGFGIKRIVKNYDSKKIKKRGKLLLSFGIIVLVSAGMGFGVLTIYDAATVNYGGGSITKGLGSSALPNSFLGGMAESIPQSAVSGNIGFSVGGAKDINNFRKNIENNYLPIPTDITYEGLFYDYYFDTGILNTCEKLFCPSYTYAATRDPFSQEEEYYISVGLNSGIKESDFQRKKLNLVIVLDISGSMGAEFSSYYYDQFGNKNINDEEGEDVNKTKIEIAAKSVVGLMDNLQDDDRLGMVLFDDQAYLAKPLNLVGKTDMQNIKDHILEITDRGGTNMESGMKMGTEQFSEYLDTDKSEYENRIIFLTDAMPNRGETSEEGLIGMTSENADNGIYTTFIGIGVDFNTELTEMITKIRGANYYSVHSADEFKKRLDDEFEFMVTPLVFDLVLQLDATGYDIEKVYGSPEANEATGEIMKINTLFPSKIEDGKTRGGIVLLKIKKTSPSAQLKLKTSYKDRNGVPGGDETEIQITESSEYFPNTGIRKGVLLSRYADLIKNWIYDERSRIGTKEPAVMDYVVNWETGITVPDPGLYQLGRWERQSSPLKVSYHYGRLFKEFKNYFNKESQSIGDNDMEREMKVLDNLINISESEADVGMLPSEVVELYMNFTLGSIPEASVDYDFAKKYLTDELKAQFTNSMFVPTSYCIQDGPDDVRIASNELVESSITVVVEGQYGGEWQKMWQFSLVPDGNSSWLISRIECLDI